MTRPKSATAASPLIDFEHPDANVFHVSWEWKLKPPARKGNRADVMFLVNGVPVCIVEHKNPKDGDAIERGITQLRRYEKETPELIGAPQLFNVTHLLDYWYGVTWNADSPLHGALEADARGNLPLRGAGVLRAHRLPAHAPALDSVLCRRTARPGNPCCASISAARSTQIVERCADAAKKRGLVWHTQGSGKTFTLLTAARLILEEKARFHNATVILVVDRTELEGQLKGWVEKLLGEMQGTRHRRPGAPIPRPSCRTCSTPIFAG